MIEDLLDFAATSQPVTTLEAVALGSLVFQCWQNVSTPSADLVLDFE